jgi:chaperone required for assembly of F1-ATPase
MTDEPANPMTAAQVKARQELPKRFYKAAAALPVDGGYAVALDGRTVRTPAGKPLAVPDLAVASALAAEWEAQKERINPGTMPLTRLVNAAIDRVAVEMAAVRADIVAYSGNDLICYRADGPDSLIEAQNAAWNPLVQWARDALGARLTLVEGVIHAPQDPEALEAVARAVEPYDALRLAALHTATTLSGSAIIALAVAQRHLGVGAAWTAAHVDEDWQMRQWGRDDMAMSRRDARFAEFEAAGLILTEARA